MSYVRGRIKRLVYERETYSVFLMESLESDSRQTKEATVTGHLFGLAGVIPGATLEVHGKWTKHSRYGWQFKASSWQPWADKTTDVTFFLFHCAKVTTSWETAKRITDALGLGTYEALKDGSVSDITEDPNEQHELSLIHQRWVELLASAALADFLQEYDLGVGYVASVFRKFGAASVEVISENPYRLLEVPGVPFQKADNLALRRGLSSCDPRRVQGGILWVLNDQTRQGHLFLPRGEFVTALPNLATYERATAFSCADFNKEVKDALEALAAREAIRIEPGVGVYLPEYYWYERMSATKIASMLQPMFLDLDADAFLNDYEQNNDIKLSSQQREGVLKLLQHKVLAVTGAPGTGKTTLVRAFVNLFQKLGMSFMLMAPTGIAAKRLGYVSGAGAQTIHRALKYDGFQWGVSSENPLGVDAVIVDECSMIDQELCHRLTDALSGSTMLVLVGDDAQLPSVGAGNVLRELLACDAVPTVRLNHVFRQAETSDIVLAAHCIREGQSPLNLPPKDKSEFCFRSTSDEDFLAESIVKMAVTLKSRDANFQVLAPKYDGVVGVDNLNTLLRDALNPDQGQPKWHALSFNLRVGDRVMVIKNNYHLNVYNGDIGKLEAVNKDSLTVRIHGVGDTPDMSVEIPLDLAPRILKLAYAVTVHKCVHPNTLVETPEGLIRAGDLPPTGNITTPQGRAAYQGVFQNPPSTMLEIETTDGYRLCVTPNHGMDVWTGSDYTRIEAEGITEGSFLRLRLGAEYPHQTAVALPGEPTSDVRANTYRLPTHMTEEVSEFLGLFVADGTLYQKGFRLAKRHKEVAERFSILCASLFGISPKHFFKNNAHHVEVSSTFLAAWLRSFQGLMPHHKDVPERVLRSSLEHQALFLRGLFEDGSVHLKKSKLDHIELRSCQPNLLNTVRVMLLRFGIITGGDQTKIYVYGVNAHRFRQAIGLISPLKVQRLQAPVGPETNYLVPCSRPALRRLVAANGGRRQLTHTDLNAFSRGTMSRHQLADLLGRCENQTPEWHEFQASLKYHHSKVKAIRVVEAPSVCVEVPEGHQFLQNGFCGWNSQGEEFETVILPIMRSQGRMLQRNLFYTAITRARQRVLLLGQTDAVLRAVANDKVVNRNTILAKLVEAAYEEANPTT